MPRLAPFGIFPTTDGFVAVCAPTEPFARGVFEAIGRPELYEDERFANRDRRVANQAELHGLIADWTATRTAAEATAAFDAQGTPAAVVRDTATAVRDPRGLRRGETVPLVHPELGPVDDLYGSGFPALLGGADGIRHAAAEARPAQRAHPRRAARLSAGAHRVAPRCRRYLGASSFV